MAKQPKVSIIIPLWVTSNRFFKDFRKFDDLKYLNTEIIIVSDKKVELPKLKHFEAKLILTGKQRTGPAEKRDIAIKKAKGSICAFIDDDAYPDKNWLKNAVKWFDIKRVVAVGGPGVTPNEDNFWQNISGGIVGSYLCSGGVQYRYLPTQKAFVVDYPAYNLLVRTSILKKVKGYNCNFYGGEDTFLCLKLIKYGDIIYDPEVVVKHHRRKFPLEHLKQIANVGLHRGYFFKKFPETSRKIFYLLPTLLTFCLITSVLLSSFYPLVYFKPFIVILLFFWFLGSWSVYRHNNSIVLSIYSGIGIILTHISYGIYFVKGLLTSNLIK